jgi:5-oxoprolinase (ATP-hydrolysing) subunit A
MCSIDLNCDIGESFGVYRVGDDSLLIPHVTSVNIACGFHAGDPRTMREAVRTAAECGAAIGAHPGFPDLTGFGRRALDVTPEEVYELVVYQFGALAGFASAAGTRVEHVKPHGALYTMAAVRPEIAGAIARAVQDVDRTLVLFGLTGSALIEAGREAGLRTAREAFADRNYLRDGTLVPRTRREALILDPDELIRRAIRLIRDRRVVSVEGEDLILEADTLCIHGDTPEAAKLAAALRASLDADGIEVRPLSRVEQVEHSRVAPSDPAP